MGGDKDEGRMGKSKRDREQGTSEMPQICQVVAVESLRWQQILSFQKNKMAVVV